MAAKWIFGSVNLYTSDQDISQEIKRAELFILGATESTYHYFGSGSQKRTLKALVVGEADKNQLLSDASTDTGRYLQTPYENFVGAKINGTPKFTSIAYTSGVIDGTTYTVDTTPMYTFEGEFIFP